MNILPDGCGISDAANEFKELCSTNNCVRNWRSFDQVFLGNFRAQVPAGRKPIATDDRECNMVSDAGFSLGGKQVTRRCFKELQYRLVFPRTRIGNINHHLCSGEYLG